mmetsp:Transcript_127599/g.408433  ORF Transcript_127599/g.408433 Transcript_127599/m.408433 type:complete len:286 (+) Transcript_127599:148-1005(+)
MPVPRLVRPRGGHESSHRGSTTSGRALAEMPPLRLKASCRKSTRASARSCGRQCAQLPLQAPRARGWAAQLPRRALAKLAGVLGTAWRLCCRSRPTACRSSRRAVALPTWQPASTTVATSSCGFARRLRACIATGSSSSLSLMDRACGRRACCPEDWCWSSGPAAWSARPRCTDFSQTSRTCPPPWPGGSRRPAPKPRGSALLRRRWRGCCASAQAEVRASLLHRRTRCLWATASGLWSLRPSARPMSCILDWMRRWRTSSSTLMLWRPDSAWHQRPAMLRNDMR